jgi:hypothetical protein
MTVLATEIRMENPFPGMNPYMERRWGDAHHRLITYACDQLQLRLPEGLHAWIEERVFVDQPDEPARRKIVRDFAVSEHQVITMPYGSAGVRDEGGVAVAEPLVVQIADEPVRQGFIEIVDPTDGNRVVTVIEFLSPANKKPGEGQTLYLEKQANCKSAGVNLVEVDLLRSGTRVLTAHESQIPPSHRTPYRACVWRARSPLTAEVYGFSLRHPLPAIKVPLRKSDQDVLLELQPLVDQIHRNGAYRIMNYNDEPSPPLSGEDAKWADQLLREKSLRK